nr:MAG TPA: hypothetical protein [Caudoviricetes sp.]
MLRLCGLMGRMRRLGKLFTAGCVRAGLGLLCFGLLAVMVWIICRLLVRFVSIVVRFWRV